jgi:hypothetical protein
MDGAWTSWPIPTSPAGAPGGRRSPPAVRFYFRWRSLADHPGARFDGVHPVKILGGLHLDQALVAVVAPASQRRLITANAGPFLDRVVFVDMNRPSPQDWAVAAFTTASGNAFTAMSPT